MNTWTSFVGPLGPAKDSGSRHRAAHGSMAQIIPERPGSSVASEVARAFHALKALPESWRVWFHVAPWEEDAPDFLILAPDRGVLVLKVSRATPEHARQAPQLQLLTFDEESPVPGEAEEQTLTAFLRVTRREGVSPGVIGAAVLFPNLTRRDIRTIEASGTTPAYAWLDREWVLGRGVEAWEELLPPAPPGEDDLHILRSEFSPEVIVPAAFVARARPRRHRTAPALADYLLDYEQEAVLKSDLDLVAEGSQLSRDFSIQLINGVAGSGKTLILLYRLRLLQSRFPRKAYQVLTHNRPLIHDMRARYAQLNGAGVSAVGWNTFMRWCRRQWPKDEAFEVLPDYRRARLVRAIWAEHLRGSGVSLRMLQGELGWVKDLGIARHEDYMEAGRQGEGSG